MYKIVFRFILMSIATVMLTSCKNSGDEPADNSPAERTILVYMLADNNLGETYEYDRTNIIDMGEAMVNVNNKGRLLIFYAGYDTVPYLMELSKGKKGDYETKKLKWYDRAVSTDSATMKTVLSDVREIAPAEDYGLIMWSHATNWLPNNRFYSPSREAAPTSFGREGSEELTINIDEMAGALKGFHHSFILFDACLMGSAEVAYELRETCDYIIASPTETMGAGYPYNKIIPLLFAKEIDYIKVCEEYYYMYIATANASGTISLIKTDEMEHLSQCCQDIVQGKELEISNLETRNIQYYDRRSPHIFFDLYDYMAQIGNDTQLDLLQSCMDNAIPYKAASNSFINIPIKKYSGLSCFIPGCSGDSITEEYYKELQWCKVVYNSSK